MSHLLTKIVLNFVLTFSKSSDYLPFPDGFVWWPVIKNWWKDKPNSVKEYSDKNYISFLLAIFKWTHYFYVPSVLSHFSLFHYLLYVRQSDFAVFLRSDNNGCINNDIYVCSGRHLLRAAYEVILLHPLNVSRLTIPVHQGLLSFEIKLF